MENNFLKYINRRGETHYFAAIPTKYEKFRYSTVKNPEGKTNLISKMPDGFEIYEHVYDAKVVLRKIIPSIIKSEYIKIVEDAIRKYSNVKDFLVKADENIITIWVSMFEQATQDNSQENEFVQFIEQSNTPIEMIKKYDDYMQFILKDIAKNIWQCYRMTYYAECGYMLLEEGNDLKKLAKKYCKHLGRDSFLEKLVPIGWEDL